MRVLVMPVYNEEKVIGELIHEFFTLDPKINIVVVEDKSTDSTLTILQTLKENKLKIIQNEINLGHGLSVVKGLEVALSLGAEVVVTADGDGNYYVQEVLQLLEALNHSNVEVVEGIRICRDDPWFRRISSFTTRLLVHLRSKKSTRDANTPFHAFRAETLKHIMGLIPEAGKVIPNMYISSIVRRESIDFSSLEMMRNHRAGNNPLGVTWNQKNRNIPSMRYMRFCIRAMFDWFFNR